MFLPLYEQARPRRTPVVTWLLMGICIWVYFRTAFSGAFEEYLAHYGFTPGLMTRVPLTFFGSYLALTPLTSIFLHGGFMHLVMNMWMLRIVGQSVEDGLGHFWYLWLYLLAGIVAAMTHYLSGPLDLRPIVGASGAIAGIMGAYLRLYPTRRIVCLWLFWLIPLPAIAFLGFWVLEQFINAAVGTDSGVAWWAHIGGFVVGYGIAGRWRSKRSIRPARVVVLDNAGRGRYV